MNTSPLTRPRKANQAGAILPVVLLLGMGLMIGVAGVVNLGFVQDDLAAAERKAIDSAIATQFLIDYQQVALSKPSGLSIRVPNENAGEPQGAIIPFPATETPATGTLLFASSPNAASSCFAVGDTFITREKGQFGDGLETTYHIGQTRPVDYSIDPEPVEIGFDLKSEAPSFLIEHLSRRFYAVTLGSGSDRIELSRLGETDIDKFYAHFWIRLKLPAAAITGASAVVPLFTNVASGATEPTFQLKFKSEITSSGGADYSITPIIPSASSALVSNSTGNMDRQEWISVHLWFDSVLNELWYRVKQRGYTVGGGVQQTLPASLTLNRNSQFTIGHVNSIAASGSIITNADQSFDVATVRVWLEPPISGASQAAGFADSLMNMDTRRPGGEFDVTTGVGQLSVAIGEPESYITLNSNDSLVSLGSGQLVASEWQPLFGQPIVFGAASGPFYVGGNPDSSVELHRGGPPASEQIYLFHSCDEQGYQFVQRIRRYTRGAGGSDQQVEWFEE